MLVVCVPSVHLVKRFPGLSVRGQYTPKPPVVFDPVAGIGRPNATASGGNRLRGNIRL